MDILPRIIGSQSRAELQSLLELELVRQNSDGNRVNFSANTGHLLYPVLCELVRLAGQIPKSGSA